MRDAEASAEGLDVHQELLGGALRGGEGPTGDALAGVVGHQVWVVKMTHFERYAWTMRNARQGLILALSASALLGATSASADFSPTIRPYHVKKYKIGVDL